MSKNQKIVIVGGGTFGLSTALHLVRSGHTDVTVLDPYDVPSPLSAGNDVNKIMQTTSNSDFYASLGLEALQAWRADPVFKEAFHETGIVYAALQDDARASIDYRYSYLEKRGDKIRRLDTPEQFSTIINGTSPTTGQYENWYGYVQEENCGWTFARLAMENAAAECRRLGAKFVVASADKIVFDQKGQCAGVVASNGQFFPADKTVICAGASSYKLLDFEKQLLAKCWTVGHIQLSAEEAKGLKEMPVVLNLDFGFIFEPDENNQLKFCNEFPGYTHFVGDDSVPLFRNAIPKEAEVHMRRFLQQIFPQFADREFAVAKICWCTDTPDRHFLFGEHPRHRGLVLGTGDSGQGFKYMPIVGKYISEVIVNGDKALDAEKRELWRWRPETGNTRDVKSLQGRSGGSNEIKDLGDISEWSEGKKKGSEGGSGGSGGSGDSTVAALEQSIRKL